MTNEQAARVDAVAKALFLKDHLGMDWDDVKIAKVEYRIPARTIESAELANQTIMDCAKRLATWYAVDRKVNLNWLDHPEGRRKFFLGQALTGYRALRGSVDVR